MRQKFCANLLSLLLCDSSEFIESGKNGLIVGMTSDELARGVASYFENEELRKQVVEQLRNEQNSNDAEIEKYIALFTELMESNV